MAPKHSRGNGEGSIYKRADGRWAGAISLPGGKRKTVYGTTRAEVANKLTSVTNDRDRGLPPVGEKLTVAAFLAQWLAAVAPTVGPRTHQSYAEIVRLHLLPELGPTKLVRLTPQMVQSLLTNKSDAGLSPVRVRYMRAVLRMALNKAVKWGLVARNVASLTDPPRLVGREMAAIEPEAAQKVLAASDGHPLGALWVLALSTGMRQGELLGLAWANVDLEGATVRVVNSLRRVSGQYLIGEPKTAKSRRTLPLTQVAVQALRTHRARQAEDRLRSPHWQDTGLVFTTPIGTPLDSSNVIHRWHAFLREHGLPKMRFHDLRHGCATLLLAQGVPMRMIMEILGHSQIGLTANLYAHVAPTLLREAANQMDAALTASR
jgi:integrase